MGGGIARASSVADPLEARGVVFLGAGAPVVLVAVDWCEIRNESHSLWRKAAAEGAGTTSERALVACVHQHDAPIADRRAELLFAQEGLKNPDGAWIIDIQFEDQVLERLRKSVKDSINATRPVTHFGVGRAEVHEVASNRRYMGPDGKPRFGRTSATQDTSARAAELGTIDPWLRTLSFWDGERAVAAISAYATHPMSYYGKGEVSADFVGLARRARQKAEPGVFQIYFSGASGNVTAGKYNDGSRENRPRLAARLEDAMARAWKATERRRIERADCHSTVVELDHSPGAPFEHRQAMREAGRRPFDRNLAAFALSSLHRDVLHHKIDLPVLDLGTAQLLLLPGESYVEFQLLAQSVRPKDFVVVAGYGECAPGYIPTERAFEEGDSNLVDWCWVGRGSEARLSAAIRKALSGGEAGR